MSVELESLELELTSNSKDAVDGIQQLIDALDALKSKTQGGAGLRAVNTQLSKISGTLSKLPTKSLDRVTGSASKLKNQLANLLSVERAVRAMGGWVSESMEYTENLNLFTVAMGKQADAAHDYAMRVNEAMGIDPSEWMRNQGLFKQIGTGFGVVEDKANLMSQNLTQLGYDIASYYNISTQEAMEKVQSGISGELEPLRRLGYALDQATLQEVARANGITKSLNAMTQAEKSQLRYIAMIEQSDNVMGDLARTLNTPANATRILQQQITQLARALGNALIPVIQSLIPWVQAAVLVLTEWANVLAALLGFEQVKIETPSLEGTTSGVGAVEDALNGATDAAKEYKKTTMGIDELTILSAPSDTGAAGGVGTDAMANLELPDYGDFLGEAQSRAAELKPILEEILGLAIAVGVGFAAWKLAGILTQLPTVSVMLTTIMNGATTGIRIVKDAVGLLGGKVMAAVPGATQFAVALKLVGVVGAIALVVERFLYLYENNEKFRVGLERVGEIVDGVFTFFGDILDWVGEKLTELGKWILDLLPPEVRETIEQAIESISKFFEQMGVDGMDAILLIGGGLLMFIPGGQLIGGMLLGFEVISLLIRGLGSLSEETWANIKQWASDSWEGVKQGAKDTVDRIILWWDGVKEGANRLWTGVSTAASDAWKSIKETIGGIPEWFGEKLNGIKAVFKGIINFFISQVNKFTGWVNDVMTFEWSDKYIFGVKVLDAGQIKFVNIPKIPLLAEGGMVDTGQLFVANEAGPELVGTIGNKTAVANQNQIVEGISLGVESANEGVITAIFTAAERMMGVIRESGGAVYLDGALLASSVTGAQNRMNRMYGRTQQHV